MAIRPIADGVWQLTGYPPCAINCYVLGTVLVDAGTRWARRRLLHDLRRHKLDMVALTHCHPDHQGVVKAICDERNVPLACHEADAPVMDGRTPMQPDNWLIRIGHRAWSGPPHPVERLLRDGDELAGFRVIHTPGHTRGHVIFFRESDRLAIAGDLLANFNGLKIRAELVEPPPFFTVDRTENRRSVLKLAKLDPAIVCFGHGPPLRDMCKLHELAAKWSSA